MGKTIHQGQSEKKVLISSLTVPLHRNVYITHNLILCLFEEINSFFLSYTCFCKTISMAVDAKSFNIFLVHMAILSDYDTFKFYLFFEGVTPPTEVEFKLESTEANIDTDFQSITSGTNNIDCPDYPGSDSSNEAVMKVTVHLFKKFPAFSINRLNLWDKI